MSRSAHLAEQKRSILAEALPLVPFDGWTARTLAEAAVAAGYDASMAQRAFPGGPGELVAFYTAETDRRMEEALARIDLAALPIRQRIALAVRTRLELMAAHREAVRRALALQARPGQAAQALRGLYHTVDAMWRAAGDTATDFNHYTKRGLLAGVYSSTLLYWLNDSSEDFAESWDFLDRRIADVMRIQKLRGRFDRCVEAVPSPWRALSALRYGARRRADAG
ncbi:MAG TPA: COQ9 family protein [Alphaproteobacteria bacterium]|nr:COQ9 family protein [Alphaproteobacteria bacterium]